MMRNDDTDEIDLSQHRASRLPGVLVIGAAIGIAAIAAWVFTPLLLSKDSAATASLLPATKARPATQDQPAALASAQATPAVATQPDTTAADDQAPPAAPAVADTTARTPWSAPAWPQSRTIVAAATPAAAVAPDTAQALQDTPAEAFDNVPLPRKRPSRLIAASLTIPLPRPRPEIEVVDAPAEPTGFDLQVERMR